MRIMKDSPGSYRVLIMTIFALIKVTRSFLVLPMALNFITRVTPALNTDRDLSASVCARNDEYTFY